MKIGDRNSRFFYASASQWRRSKWISKLKRDSNGVCVDTLAGIKRIIEDHFTDIFNLRGQRNFSEPLDIVDPVVTAEMNENLLKPISSEEVKAAIYQLGALKAPGLGGFSGIFYSTYWDIVGVDVRCVVNVFFEGKCLRKELNITNLALILKCLNPESFSQFRTISLCNFIYNSFSKTMANRLRPFLYFIISPYQLTFVPSRAIQNNVLVAQEMFHALKLNSSMYNGKLALKIDLNKAYDHLEWDFLAAILRKMGFTDKWIDLTMQCVSTVHFNIMVKIFAKYVRGGALGKETRSPHICSYLLKRFSRKPSLEPCVKE